MGRMAVQRVFSFFPVFTLVCMLVTLCVSCGLFQNGSSCGIESAPSGGVQAYTGTFSGMNGQTVTGSVTIYRVAGEVVIRLSSLTAPSETGMKVVLAAAAGDVFSRAMTYTCGSFNVATGQNLPQNLSSVRIDSTRSTVNNTYGIATLTSSIPVGN